MSTEQADTSAGVFAAVVEQADRCSYSGREPILHGEFSRAFGRITGENGEHYAEVVESANGVRVELYEDERRKNRIWSSSLIRDDLDYDGLPDSTRELQYTLDAVAEKEDAADTDQDSIRY